MRKIVAEDTAVIAGAPEAIWQAISDFNLYAEWWPSSVKILVRKSAPGIIGSQVDLKPFGGRAFLCEVESIREGAELRVKYSGVYRGPGVWTIAAEGGNCRVTYRVDLEIADPIMKILSFIIPIPRLHSSLMRKVFAGLAGYVAKDRAVAGCLQ
jgi:ribosome-associated toxin RatA of RatAB toxin-antitoxin module